MSVCAADVRTRRGRTGVRALSRHTELRNQTVCLSRVPRLVPGGQEPFLSQSDRLQTKKNVVNSIEYFCRQEKSKEIMGIMKNVGIYKVVTFSLFLSRISRSGNRADVNFQPGMKIRFTNHLHLGNHCVFHVYI